MPTDTVEQLRMPLTLAELSEKALHFEYESMPYLYLAARMKSEITEKILPQLKKKVKEQVRQESDPRPVQQLQGLSAFQIISGYFQKICSNGCRLQETGNLIFTLSILAEFNYVEACMLLQTIQDKKQNFVNYIKRYIPNIQYAPLLRDRVDQIVDLRFALDTIKTLQELEVHRVKTKNRFLENRIIIAIYGLEYLLKYQETTDLSKDNIQVYTFMKAFRKLKLLQTTKS